MTPIFMTLVRTCELMIKFMDSDIAVMNEIVARWMVRRCCRKATMQCLGSPQSHKVNFKPYTISCLTKPMLLPCFNVGIESRRPVVAVVDPDTAKLNQHTGIQIREIALLTPLVMEAVCSHQVRSLDVARRQVCE